MRRSVGFYKRLALLSLHQDLVRGIISLLVLSALFLSSAPIWLVLVAPVATYVALRLLLPDEPGATRIQGAQRTRRMGASGTLEAIRTARVGISECAEAIPDTSSADRARTIASWIDRSIDAIKEDGTTDALNPLRELAQFTNDLLARYIKLCRRGLADVDAHAQMRQNLATIEARFQWFWEQLNRNAIIDLEALSAAIDLFVQTETVTSMPEPDSAPTPTPIGSGDEAASGEDRREKELIATLTTREVEVLRHLAAGRRSQQIADALFISKFTVDKHTQQIFGKLGVQNRAEAAAFATRNGIVCPRRIDDTTSRPGTKNT